MFVVLGHLDGRDTTFDYRWIQLAVSRRVTRQQIGIRWYLIDNYSRIHDKSSFERSAVSIDCIEFGWFQRWFKNLIKFLNVLCVPVNGVEDSRIGIQDAIRLEAIAVTCTILY